jgi:hypothetical protein
MLGDALRRVAAGDRLDQIEPVRADGEDADVSAGSVRHEQVPPVAREDDRAL